jgi:hypothetical protein
VAVQKQQQQQQLHQRNQHLDSCSRYRQMVFSRRKYCTHNPALLHTSALPVLVKI